MSSSSLNPPQRQAVRHDGGPLLVLAGAGSGKTRVIVHRVAWLIDRRHLPPEQVYCITFTNKAAREMKQRLAGLLGSRRARGVWVSTFHRLGLAILRAEGAALGLRPGFSILDGEDTEQVLRDLLGPELTADPAMVRQVRVRLSRWKNDLAPPSPGEADDPVGRAAAAVYQDYQAQLRACNAVDLDDLIGLPLTLLEDEAVALRWRARVGHLLVDEYQDTNAAQYALVRRLAGRSGALTVVGDDDQSIYAWRGARPENLADLARDWPGLSVIKLEQNYRSTGRILEAANALIAHNPHVFPKRLWSAAGTGDPVVVVRARDEEDEAQQVVSAILSRRLQEGCRHGDFAVLYRGNHQSRRFEQALREHRIPYHLSGETSFFERSEVRDLMAYLRLAANPADDNAFLRVVNTPRRGIGAATLRRLQARAAGGGGLLAAAADLEGTDRGSRALRGFAHWLGGLEADRRPPVEVVEEILRETDYEGWLREGSANEAAWERRRGHVRELVDWLARLARRAPDKSLAELVADLIVAGILDRDEDPDGDRVALMTLHAAKGLEFAHVFIVGVEEGSLPHHSSVEAGDIEEERRLFYVGMTRARRSLTLSFAARRRRHGQVVDCTPSRFLEELPRTACEWRGTGEPLPEEERRARARAHVANLRALLE